MKNDIALIMALPSESKDLFEQAGIQFTTVGLVKSMRHLQHLM